MYTTLKIENPKDFNENTPLFLSRFDIFDLDSKSLDKRYRLVSKSCDLEVNASVKKLIDFLRDHEGESFTDIAEIYPQKYKIKKADLHKAVSSLYKKGIVNYTNEKEDSFEYHRNKLEHLWLKIKLVDTEKRDAFFRPFVFLFSKPAVFAVLAIFAILDVSFWLQYGSESWRQQLVYFTRYDYMFMMVYSFMLVLFHEAGHIVAAKKFNAKTGDIGIGVYYYLLIGYADVHETWNLKIPQRMVVSIGGAYWGLIFMLPVFVILFLTHSKSLADFILVFHFGFIFIFNPFIKMDGYWFISDVLGIPNLKSKVLIYLYKYLPSKVFRKNNVNNIFASYPLKIRRAVVGYLILFGVFMVYFSIFILYKSINITLNFNMEIVSRIMFLIGRGSYESSVTVEFNTLLRNTFFLVIGYKIMWSYLKSLLMKIYKAATGQKSQESPI